MKQKLNRIPLKVSVHLRYLYQDKGVRGKELLEKYPMYSKTSIYRHAVKPIMEEPLRYHRNNIGRPRKISERDKRLILRQIPLLRAEGGSLTIKRLRLAAGIDKNYCCDQTIRRVLHSEGYRYYHSRKKGLLTKKDLRNRLKFARKVKRLLSDRFWKEGLSFYLDGCGFQHKQNPCDEARSVNTMAWRRRDEGLHPSCTAKGSHVGSGGKVAHFFVAISYRKGVILCEQYFGRLNGAMFAKFIKKHFKKTFRKGQNTRGRIFLQDGDPSQNSRLAKKSLKKVGARKFSIPARSPDCNPIENVFNYAKQKLHEDALVQNITFENFTDFSQRVKNTIMNLPIEYIDKTIDSMDRRMSLIIKGRGKRIKY